MVTQHGVLPLLIPGIYCHLGVFILATFPPIKVIVFKAHAWQFWSSDSELESCLPPGSLRAHGTHDTGVYKRPKCKRKVTKFACDTKLNIENGKQKAIIFQPFLDRVRTRYLSSMKVMQYSTSFCNPWLWLAIISNPYAIPISRVWQGDLFRIKIHAQLINPFYSSWWLQHIWKYSSNWIMSSIFRVKINKIFQNHLPYLA